MTHRMVIATCALLGLIISTYLLLYHLGVIGELQCGTGGCERVQTSRFAEFIGLPVPLYGVVGYVAIFVAAMLGVQPKWTPRREPATVLAGLSTIGFAFTVYLNYVEFFVIRAICFWCTISAVLISAIVILSWLDYRRGRRPSAL